MISMYIVSETNKIYYTTIYWEKDLQQIVSWSHNHSNHNRMELNYYRGSRASAIHHRNSFECALSHWLERTRELYIAQFQTGSQFNVDNQQQASEFSDISMHFPFVPFVYRLNYIYAHASQAFGWIFVRISPNFDVNVATSSIRHQISQQCLIFCTCSS